MVLEGCVEKLHDELEYNRSLLKHIGRNVIFEPAGNERGATTYIPLIYCLLGGYMLPIPPFTGTSIPTIENKPIYSGYNSISNDRLRRPPPFSGHSSPSNDQWASREVVTVDSASPDVMRTLWIWGSEWFSR